MYKYYRYYVLILGVLSTKTPSGNTLYQNLYPTFMFAFTHFSPSSRT